MSKVGHTNKNKCATLSFGVHELSCLNHNNSNIHIIHYIATYKKGKKITVTYFFHSAKISVFCIS